MDTDRGCSKNFCHGIALYAKALTPHRSRLLGSTKKQEVCLWSTRTLSALADHFQRQKDQALSLLSRLHIVTITALTREEPQTVALTKNFGSSLRLALTGGGDHQSFGVPSSDLVTADVDLDFLDEHARTQWEGILHYMVNSVGEGMRQEGQGPANSVKQLLEAGKLVTRGRGVGITQAGFSFLLQEVNAQVWTLLLLWIENAEQVSTCFHSFQLALTKSDGNG